jgi:hypothetical protein
MKNKRKSYFLGSLGRDILKPWHHGYTQMMDKVKNNSIKQDVLPLSKA